MGRFEIADETRLRLLEHRDAAELHALIEANRPYLARWLPWAAVQTPADTEEFIARTRAQLAANDGFQVAIVSAGEIAGVAGFHGVDWDNRCASIGYWLSEDHQGHGTATAAVRLLTEHALAVWDLERVEIRAAVDNRRSRAIPERLGFREEATMRKVERVGDRHLDCVIYSMVPGRRRDEERGGMCTTT
jgi:ribosomal-protein-serine acetyltransferase